ncbi:hypothetical protein CON68_22005, partial [Bacillus toyonensis]
MPHRGRGPAGGAGLLGTRASTMVHRLPGRAGLRHGGAQEARLTRLAQRGGPARRHEHHHIRSGACVPARRPASLAGTPGMLHGDFLRVGLSARAPRFPPAHAPPVGNRLLLPRVERSDDAPEHLLLGVRRDLPRHCLRCLHLVAAGSTRAGG